MISCKSVNFELKNTFYKETMEARTEKIAGAFLMLILIYFDSRKHTKSGDKVRGVQDYLEPQKCGPGRSKCN